MSSKRKYGQYYTIGDPFQLKPFKQWANKIKLKNKIVLEPFAGSNNLIKLLQKNNLAKKFVSFDIEPTHKNVKKRDTLKNFPEGFDVVITNPPWLAKNSANRRNLPFPKTKHDDVYKHCLEKCLQNTKYVGALVPATFLQSGLFRDRLDTFIMLHDKEMFFDTENPVALALFSQKPKAVKIYHDNDFVGMLNKLESYIPTINNSPKIKFNKPNGNLGFIAFDNTTEPTIRFCKASELDKYEIKHTTRMITKITIQHTDINFLINRLNRDVKKFRRETEDIFLTPFKGLRKDGRYRRRMDYLLAKSFISKYV